MTAVDRIGSLFLRQILRRMKQLGLNQSALAKQKGHPSIAGMKSIADQVTASVMSLMRANR